MAAFASKAHFVCSLHFAYHVCSGFSAYVPQAKSFFWPCILINPLLTMLLTDLDFVLVHKNTKEAVLISHLVSNANILLICINVI